MTIPLIRLDNITVRLRDRWLLEGSSWTIHCDEQWAVLGPNGSGKTTLAKALAGRLPVVRGAIHYHGFGHGPPREAIAYVASDARRDWWRRERAMMHAWGFAGRCNDRTLVREWLGHRFSGPPSTIAEPAAIDAVARRFGLTHLLDKPLMAISTGESCRLMVARALVRHPRMLILDEPFEGLDVMGRREVSAMLNDLAVDGLPVVLIAHRREELLPATTHVLTMDRGRIRDAGPVNGRSRPSLGRSPAAPGQRQLAALLEPSLVPTDKAPPEGMPLIEMCAVTVRYGATTVLDRLTWTVAAGEHWAVTGPNGAGKTTLLKLITGECLQVYANRIRLFGKDRTAELSLGAVRERLGVVSHDLAAAYQKSLVALDVVCSGFYDSVGLYRHCDTRQQARAMAWLATLDMADVGRVPFNQLSQGQRQMVLIARAMVKSPQLLILDEPCAGLDAENRRRVLAVVARIGRRGSAGLIVVAHHEADLPDGITHRLILDRGRIQYSGPADRR